MYSHYLAEYINKTKVSIHNCMNLKSLKPHIYTCEVVRFQTRATVNICCCFLFCSQPGNGYIY